MRPLPLALAALLFYLLPGYDAAYSTGPSYESHDYYVLEHDPWAGISLKDVLKRMNFELVEQAGRLENHWLVRRHKHNTKRSDLESLLLSRRRGQALSERGVEALDIVRSVKHLSLQELRQRTKRDTSQLRAPPPPIPQPESNQTSADIAKTYNITDPAFPDQWHLANDEFPMHMVNAAPVWEMGNAGEGVIAAMVDDGLDYESDDLASNFDATNSYDYNLHVPLPKPILFDDHHGTRCAGQIAAAKNSVCGIGIAHKAKVAGIRILSGPISDVDEAAALNYGFDNTSIYSCSWGPPDDGRSMEGPSYLIQKAVVNGILNGRGGKGSVFVFASGNGAAQGDQCNFDGYTNSIYSVTVAAVDYKGLHPYYSEACAANMVVTYSSGGGKHIVTTDVGKDECSHSHGGTSAAAPNAVGIFALALSIRPDLSWRDIQHLCVRSAKMINSDDPDWEDTAAGRRFSYKYGYGSLDAFAYVQAAKDWTLVKPQAWLHTVPIQLDGGIMTLTEDTFEMTGGAVIGAGGVSSTTSITKEMLSDNNFERLEHITVKVWITHSRRGDVEVELVSPGGIKSVLAGKRKRDEETIGFPGWTFMTIKHWDEDPVGDWIIRVSDQESEHEHGNFLGWTMTLWGSVIDASKAKTFVLTDPDTPFPPPPPEDTEIPPEGTPTASTKTHPKPTEHLPGDHGTAEGEADKPAFSSGAPSVSMSSTPDEGWFPGMYNLVKNSKWVFGAISVVVVFAVSAGTFLLWRRHASRRDRANYTNIAGDDVAMGSMGTGRASRSVGRIGSSRTKELYDAFGEVPDDEFADEETGLRKPLTESADGYHSGFLDDDDVTPSHLEGQHTSYRDEPSDRGGRLAAADDGTKSPDSGDGSWEHASVDRDMP